FGRGERRCQPRRGGDGARCRSRSGNGKRQARRSGGKRMSVSRRDAATAPPKTPILHVTPYEQVSSGLIATVAALIVIVSLLSFAWYATRQPKAPPAIPVELVESPGGVEDGSPDETLRIDSPLPEAPDATIADVAAEEPEVAQSLESVMAS